MWCTAANSSIFPVDLSRCCMAALNFTTGQ
jgi:hypothetical protein